jgi:hypothetical protein
VFGEGSNIQFPDPSPSQFLAILGTPGKCGKGEEQEHEKIGTQGSVKKLQITRAK